MGNKQQTELKSNVPYPMNDMDSVYTHYNPKTGKNEQTPNILKGGIKHGKSSK